MIKYWTAILCFGAVVLCIAGCGGVGDEDHSGGYIATFRELPVPVGGNEPGSQHPGSWPDDIAADAAGNIWFAMHHANEIGRMAPDGTYTGFPVPTPNS